MAPHIFASASHVLEDRAVRIRVFDGDEDLLVHVRVHSAPADRLHTSSHTFSPAIRTATGQASQRIHRGATDFPIFFASPVNITSGNTANGSCRLRMTWLRMSSWPVPRSP